MATVSPDKQYLRHELSVIFCRSHYVRCRASSVTGKMIIMCRAVDLKKIMLEYTQVQSYRVYRVTDTTTGKIYPELQTDLIINEED